MSDWNWRCSWLCHILGTVLSKSQERHVGLRSLQKNKNRRETNTTSIEVGILRRSTLWENWAFDSSEIGEKSRSLLPEWPGTLGQTYYWWWEEWLRRKNFQSNGDSLKTFRTDWNLKGRKTRSHSSPGLVTPSTPTDTVSLVFVNLSCIETQPCSFI